MHYTPVVFPGLCVLWWLGRYVKLRSILRTCFIPQRSHGCSSLLIYSVSKGHPRVLYTCGDRAEPTVSHRRLMNLLIPSFKLFTNPALPVSSPESGVWSHNDVSFFGVGTIDTHFLLHCFTAHASRHFDHVPSSICVSVRGPLLGCSRSRFYK